MTEKTITVENTVWHITPWGNGHMYANTTNGITGVAYRESDNVFSYAVVVDGETEPYWTYDNAEFASWNVSSLHSLILSMLHTMYEAEQDMIEDEYDRMYSIGEEHDDYGYDAYDPYERDSDLMNEW